ncbi:MAG: D-alanyl-D-alanine carboxypeptidase [Fimbriimonadaceae bacterium]
MLLALVFAPDLSADLDRILAAKELKNAVVAVRVEKMDGAVLYSRGAEIRAMPASNQKLLTCAYALDKLGADFRPRTRFWKLEDRVAVESSGDPMMTFGQLREVRKKLELDGKLPVYVRQAYNPGTGPSWEWDDLPNKYAAPISAFTVDRGSFEIWAENGKLFYMPQNYGTRVSHINSRGSVRVRYSPNAGHSSVTGKLPTVRTRLDTLALREPWKAAGSILGGPVLTGFSVPTRDPDLVVDGAPLREMLKECLTKSDNNIAEHLLLLAAKSEGPLSEEPWKVAGERLTRFLSETVGIPEEQIEPSDGSGLSRHNLITARAITTLLRWAIKQPTAEIWLASLAIPSAMGTLEKRLAGSTFRGKTGTLTGACSLSGYLTTAGGETLVVSMIFNNYRGSSVRIRDIQDDFVRRLEKIVKLPLLMLTPPQKHARDVPETGSSGSAGTVLAQSLFHESDLTNAFHRSSDWNRRRGYDRDGLASRAGHDRRDESDHAALPGKQRMAVYLR